MEKIANATFTTLDRLKDTGAETGTTLETIIKEKLKEKMRKYSEDGLPGFIVAPVLTDLHKITMKQGIAIDKSTLQQKRELTDDTVAQKVERSSGGLSRLPDSAVMNKRVEDKLSTSAPAIIRAGETKSANAVELLREPKRSASPAINEISVPAETEAAEDVNGCETAESFLFPAETREERPVKNAEMTAAGTIHPQPKTLSPSELILANKAATDRLVSDSAPSPSTINVHSVVEAETTGSRLTYTFTEWGKNHQVNIQLADVKAPVTLQPSNELVHQRLAGYGGQQKEGQPEWVFHEEESKQEKKPHKFDEEAS